MKSKTSNPYYHIFYWIFVVLILTLVFGRSWGSKIHAFYYISLLLPVVMGTSYFFNYYLVPFYLLKKKYFWFILYFFYTLIISLYIEIIVLTFSFIYLVNFKIGKMGPHAFDTLLLAILLYMVVFLGSFLLMIQQFNDSQKEINNLKDEKDKMKSSFLELISNRKTIRIPYKNILFIESLADYIKVNSIKGEEFLSKEKISAIEKRLPDIFLRIHRSFIVNTEKITSFNYEEVQLEGVILKIGRSYKKLVLNKIRSANSLMTLIILLIILNPLINQ